jgi:hypothetical protein
MLEVFRECSHRRTHTNWCPEIEIEAMLSLLLLKRGKDEVSRVRVTDGHPLSGLVRSGDPGEP